MATKTISIDLEAYERLRAARKAPDESFSRVIKRARWPSEPHTAAALLDALVKSPIADEDTLAGLDAAQRSDAPPESRWQHS